MAMLILLPFLATDETQPGVAGTKQMKSHGWNTDQTRILWFPQTHCVRLVEIPLPSEIGQDQQDQQDEQDRHQQRLGIPSNPSFLSTSSFVSLVSSWFKKFAQETKDFIICSTDQTRRNQDHTELIQVMYVLRDAVNIRVSSVA